jgi:DMATS type aromatic prenyltransferase
MTAPQPSTSGEQSQAWHLVHARKDVLINTAQHYWFQTSGRVLAGLLQEAKYSEQAQFDALHRFAYLVAPHLGALPMGGVPSWQSFMTDDHTPIELSWDFHTGTEDPTIRYSIEPVSLDAGLPSDPDNVRAGAEFKEALLDTSPNTDMTWFSHFEKFFVHSWTKSAAEGHPSSVFWAFDLKGAASTSKAYFFPGPIAQATGQSNLAVVMRAILSAPGYNLKQANPLGVFASYADQRPPSEFRVEILALDLVPIDESRLKVYFRDRRTDFNSVRETMSLGGRVYGEDFDLGMEKLRTLWGLLFSVQGSSDDESLSGNTHRTAGILYNVEFRARSKQPKVKIYIPVRHYATSDEQIIEAIAEYLEIDNANEHGAQKAQSSPRRYQQCMHNIFGKANLSNGLGVHTYIGCSVQAHGKLRVVAYMNPQETKLLSMQE